MTGTSARNNHGIFKTKKAYNLALLYNLELHNKNAYIHSGKFISFNDVEFIVDNLWLDYFMGLNTYPPLYNISIEYENLLINNLQLKYPYLNTAFSWA